MPDQERVDLDALEALRAKSDDEYNSWCAGYLPWKEYNAALRSAAPAMLCELRRLRKVEEAATACVNYGWGQHHRKQLIAALETHEPQSSPARMPAGGAQPNEKENPDHA